MRQSLRTAFDVFGLGARPSVHAVREAQLHRLLAIDSHRLEAEVMRQTCITSSRTWRVVSRLRLAEFALRAQLVETFREIKSAPGDPLLQLGFKARLAGLLPRLCFQPPERSTAQPLEVLP